MNATEPAPATVAPAQPLMPTWVWLHTPYLLPRVTDRIQAALRRRGLFTCLDRTDSWHAARAGLVVIEVYVPIAQEFEDTPVAVRKIRARYAGPLDHSDDADAVTLLDFVPLDAPGTRSRPRTLNGELDVEQLAEWAAELADRRLVGSGEAGRHLGLDPRDVRTRLSRGEFPEPDDYEMRGTIRQPVWYASTLDAWTPTRRGRGRPRKAAPAADD